MGRTRKIELQRTISIELFNAWQRLKRRGDPEKMAEELQYSRPVIDKALIYGYVTMPELTDKINGYFMKRLKSEQGVAAELMQLADTVEGAQK